MKALSRNRNSRRCRRCEAFSQAGRAFKAHSRHCGKFWTVGVIHRMERIARRRDCFFDRELLAGELI